MQQHSGLESPLESPTSLEDAKNRRRKAVRPSSLQISNQKQKPDFAINYLETSLAKMEVEKERLDHLKASESIRANLEREKMELEKTYKEREIEMKELK